MASKEIFYRTLERVFSPQNLKAGTFIYGEQALATRLYLDRWKKASPGTGNGPEFRTYFLFDTDWSEILDEASSLDIFSSGRDRIFIIYFPEDDHDDWQAGDKAYRQLLAPAEDRLVRYFQQPPDWVFLIIIFDGKLKRGQKLLNFFERLENQHKNIFQTIEIKTPRDNELLAWINDEMKSKGKKIEVAAARRLLEICGPDLVLLSQEMEKLSLYPQEKDEITEADVLETGTVRQGYDRFALEEALESGSLQQALMINRSFFVGEPAVIDILNYFSAISRYIISLNQAKVQVGRWKKPIREIFKKSHPQLVEGWSLFDRKLQAFTACLEAFSQEELDNLVHELARLDLDLKSSDLKPEILIETFLIKYFALRDKKLG
ncbi:MAG: DNA polymerase III subunit delta [Candidatus Saccharicenans sp.]|nr:DNA polymerase III subunit delta [Candidatus Saccharicenans sp.]